MNMEVDPPGSGPPRSEHGSGPPRSEHGSGPPPLDGPAEVPPPQDGPVGVPPFLDGPAGTFYQQAGSGPSTERLSCYKWNEIYWMYEE